MARTNHALMLLTVALLIFLIGYLLESLKVGNAFLRDYFQISTEMLPIVFSFSIFIMTWFVYDTSKDDHSLFMGWVLFIVGMIDMYHFLSYPFMPDFISPNSAHKAEIFWAEGRLISAILILASVYIYNGTIPKLKEKSVLFASISVIVISFISLTSGVYETYFPLLSNPDGSPTADKIVLLLISSAIILYACYLYLERMRQTGHKNLLCLIYGFFLIIASNLVYLHFDYSGHLLKGAAFYFLYLGLFKSSFEVPYEKLAEAGEKRFHEVEEKFRSLFDNANDAIIITDLENRVTSWNKSAERIFGWTEKEMLGENFMPMAFDQKLQAENEQIIRNAISGGAVSGIETVLTRKDGARIDVSMTVSPLRNTNQEVVGLSGIFRDITERKRAEEQIKESLKEKEVLLREIHHRVKNNMQIISSLLRLQSASIKDKKSIDMYKDSQNRIISMSLIHEKLYHSGDIARIDIKEYIRDLVAGLFESYGVNTGKVALNIKAENISLGINSAIPCGLIINEIVSNSLKYAFPGDKRGEIKIDLRSIEGNYFELLISDNGIGLPKEMDIKKTDSWGLRLVSILAENQLQGELTVNRNYGTEFRIKFRDVS